MNSLTAGRKGQQERFRFEEHWNLKPLLSCPDFCRTLISLQISKKRVGVGSSPWIFVFWSGSEYDIKHTDSSITSINFDDRSLTPFSLFYPININLHLEERLGKEQGFHLEDNLLLIVFSFPYFLVLPIRLLVIRLIEFRVHKTKETSFSLESELRYHFLYSHNPVMIILFFFLNVSDFCFCIFIFIVFVPSFVLAYISSIECNSKTNKTKGGK
jgi:hypothetical protein